MKILFLTHRFPHPPNRGDSIRSFHFLRRMASMGKVWLGTLYDQTPQEESWEVLNGLCENVLAVPWGKWGKWRRAAVSLAMGKTMTEGLFSHPVLRRGLQEWARQESWDVVVVFCSSMFPYIAAMEPIWTRRPRIVTDLVDVDSQKWFDYAREAPLWKKILFRTEGKRLREWEKKVGQKSDVLLAVTDEEVALYRSFCPIESIFSVPNGVDTEYFNAEQPFLQAEVEIPCRGVFVGALDYQANVEGVRWFLEKVLPPLRKRCPDFVLDIVGNRPTATLQQVCRNTPGAHLIGGVPDVRPYLKRTQVVVIPLQVARGLQNKVLEACSMGKAVVVSPCAAEGIQGVAGQDFVVCSSVEAWQQTLPRLFEEESRRTLLGQAGRKLVVEKYGWQTQLDRLASFLKVS
ncbi:MAG: TIGR03087 family PEP-CTERM/XrtA system glycosyltransferase [Planctomycetia bacterium]|nr:TIGR03087 family PEP-CTERM/XrtA system glycosyltransferase [Planctomycetia bacterium]